MALSARVSSVNGFIAARYISSVALCLGLVNWCAEPSLTFKSP